MTDKVSLGKLATGVPGLDVLLGGGLNEFSFNLITGAPGAGISPPVEGEPLGDALEPGSPPGSVAAGAGMWHAERITRARLTRPPTRTVLRTEDPFTRVA